MKWTFHEICQESQEKSRSLQIQKLQTQKSQTQKSQTQKTQTQNVTDTERHKYKIAPHKKYIIDPSSKSENERVGVSNLQMWPTVHPCHRTMACF